MFTSSRMGLLPHHHQSLEPGLYFVATPIGTARDITLRALDILASADVLAAEDTRNTRHLLDLHAVALQGRPLIPYHDHNGPAQRPRLIGLIESGKSVAYVSDAGTPLVSDPGYALARAAIDRGLNVVTAPGPSAVLAALTVAGLPTDQFFFAGFVPQKQAARRKMLENLVDVPGSLVFFENAKRVGKTLIDMVQTFGNREAALCRELTKKFEETHRARLADLAKDYETRTPRGEIVLIVAPPDNPVTSTAEMEMALRSALARDMSTRDAAASVASATGLPRKTVYQAALKIGKSR